MIEINCVIRRDHTFAGHYSASPDDAVMKGIAKDYADRHATMKKPDVCGGDIGFPEGITNGAYWYELEGTDTFANITIPREAMHIFHYHVRKCSIVDFQLK